MNGQKASEDRPTCTTEAVEYDHFSVYPEVLSNFTVKFAGKVEAFSESYFEGKCHWS